MSFTSSTPIGLSFVMDVDNYRTSSGYGFTSTCSMVGVDGGSGRSAVVCGDCDNCAQMTCGLGGCDWDSENSVCNPERQPGNNVTVTRSLKGSLVLDKGCPDVTQCSLDGLSDCNPLQQTFVSSASWKVPPGFQPGATSAGADRAQGTIYCTYAVWDPADVNKIYAINPSSQAGTLTFDRLRSLFVRTAVYAACSSLAATVFSAGEQTPPACRETLTVFDEQFDPNVFYECCLDVAKIPQCQATIRNFVKAPEFDLSAFAKSCFALPTFHYDAAEGHVVYLPLYTKTILDIAGPTETLDYDWSDATKYYTQEIFEAALWSFLGDKDPTDPAKTVKQAQVSLDASLKNNTIFLTFEGDAPKAHNAEVADIVAGKGDPDPSGDWSTQFVLGRVYKGVVKKWSLTLLALFASAKSLQLPCDDPAWKDLFVFPSACFEKKCSSDGDAACRQDLQNYCDADFRSRISLDPDNAADVLSGFLVAQDSPQCECEGAYMVPPEEQGNEAIEHAARCFDLTCRGYETYYGLSDADCRGNCDLVRSFFWDRPAGERPRLARPDQAKFERLCGPLNPLPFNFAAFGVACGLSVLVYLLVTSVFGRRVGWKLSLLFAVAFFGLALFAGFDLAGTARCSDPPNQKSVECRSKITNLKIPIWCCRLLVPCSCQSDADCKDTETCTSQVCVPKPDACLVPKPQGEPCKAFPNYRGFCDKDLDFFKSAQSTSGCDEDPGLARFVKLPDKTCYPDPPPTPASMDKDGPFCYYPGNPFPKQAWPAAFPLNQEFASDIKHWAESRYTGDCFSEQSKTWYEPPKGIPDCAAGQLLLQETPGMELSCATPDNIGNVERFFTKDYRRACLSTPWPPSFPLSGPDASAVLDWARGHYTGECSSDRSKAWYPLPPAASGPHECPPGNLALLNNEGLECCRPETWSNPSTAQTVEADIAANAIKQACVETRS